LTRTADPAPGITQPGNLRVCRRGSFREQAGLAEAAGSHQQHQWLASGLGPSEQYSALRPGPVGRGTAISWLWTDMLSSVWMGLFPGDLGSAPATGAGAARFTLPRVIGG